ncbi:GAF domain-containing sensor histidine kinase [Chungangia koreensis]|uniref:histidine kinase n=1 Tax=Chungangia koreensis TaxID=752657 RepID=A0ABV8X656_9LACT
MSNKVNTILREKQANTYLIVISFLGTVIYLWSIFNMDVEPSLNGIVVFLILIAFLWVTENYPMPVWRGFTSISFPIIYTIFITSGLEAAIVAYSTVILLNNLVKRRPVRIIFFNLSQLALSLLMTNFLTAAIIDALLSFSGSFSRIMIHMVLFTSCFYVINNALVDLLLKLRPQRYTLEAWFNKTISEFRSFLISAAYLSLVLLLGSQNRGSLDILSVFFVFSPLIAAALLMSVIVKIQTEKNRLKSLFSTTTELNRSMLSGDGYDEFHRQISSFVDFESLILWTNEEGEWEKVFTAGEHTVGARLSSDQFNHFTELNGPLMIADRRFTKGPADDCFREYIRSLIYAPLIVENKTVGMMALGRSRSNSFTEEDLSMVATLANQLAIILTTRSLLAEQERSLILEERNRIAREIHDGIAQSLAGAVMKLETATRIRSDQPEYSMELVQDSLTKLRLSLKEIRESIYALRPLATVKNGLKKAIKETCHKIQEEFPITIVFEERGESYPLGTEIEKIIFDIFKESIHNITKHANAKNVQVLLSFQQEHILLKIKDDGIGFSLVDALLLARREPHFGILNMNDSADKIDASLQIDSKKGMGTEVSLSIPKQSLKGGRIDDQRVVGR